MSKAIGNQNIKERFLEDFATFEQSLNGELNTAYHQKRKKAIADFERLGWPGNKDESWKYTSLRAVRDQFYETAEPQSIDANDYNDLNLLHKSEEAHQLVFVNGFFDKANSIILEGENEEVVIDNIAALRESKPELTDRYINSFENVDNSLAALNMAFSRDGLFVLVPDNQQLKYPIHFINITDARNECYASHPRNVVVFGKNSSGSIYEIQSVIGEKKAMMNHVTEILIAENADASYQKIQHHFNNSFQLNQVLIQQARDSRLNSNLISFDGKLVRNQYYLLVNGQNCESNINGLYVLDNDSHVDNHTLVIHAEPNCQSNQLFKGILDDESTGIFDGKIIVKQKAQKTNAFQLSKNVLLSDSAKANNKPQLEIFADDVKCSHGATTGQMDKEAVFYLMSRGISKREAQAMILQAFAADVINKIPNESLCAKLESLLKAKLEKN